MAKRLKTVSRAAWRASPAAGPASAEVLHWMTGRAINALRAAEQPSSRRAVSRVIFACRGNAGRSQMAVALFNQLADPQRARAISAGTGPSSTVDPNVIEALRETGVDLSPSIPRPLNAPLATSAGHLVTMGCQDDCPFFAGVRVQDWPIDDPQDQPVERVREICDDIRRRVVEMIAHHGWGHQEGT